MTVGLPRKPFLPTGLNSTNLAFHQDDVLAATRPLELSQNTRLADLNHAWVFFTPGLWYILGRPAASRAAVFDLYTTYCEEYPRESLDLRVASFAEPLFAGMVYADGDQVWNYSLHALPKDQAEKFLTWADQIAVHQPDKKLVLRVHRQEVQIFDPVDIDRRVPYEQAGRIPLTNLTIETNKGSFSFRGVTDRGRPKVFFDAAVSPEMQQYAARVLTGVQDIYNVASQSPVAAGTQGVIQQGVDTDAIVDKVRDGTPNHGSG